MLRFFHQIRQRLLTNNKCSKYLLYAIGEILLVVIGILIALQIDNWNQEKKERQLELGILKEVRDNLSDDLSKIESSLVLQNEILRCQTAFIEWLDGEKDYDDGVPYFSNSLSYYITRSLLKPRFLANQGTYETLKDLGMNIIQDDSLRIQLTHLYEVAYPRYRLDLKDYEEVVNSCLLLFEEYLEELNWFEPLEFLDLEGLRSDRRIHFRIKSMHNQADLLPNRNSLGTKKDIEKALRLLKEELEKRRESSVFSK